MNRFRICLLISLLGARLGAAPTIPDIPLDSRAIPPAILPLVERLYLPDPQAQAKALIALDEQGDAAIPAMPYVLRLAGARDRVADAKNNQTELGEIARTLLAKLAKVSPATLIPELRDTASADLLRHAIQALEGCTLPDFDQRLMDLAELPDEMIRKTACGALVPRYGSPEHAAVTERLHRALAADPAFGVRLQIALAAATNARTNPAVEPLVVKVLQDPDPRVWQVPLQVINAPPSRTILEAVLARADTQGRGSPEMVRFLDRWLPQQPDIFAELLAKMGASELDEVRQKSLFLAYSRLKEPVPAFLERLRAEKSDQVRRDLATWIFEPWVFLPALAETDARHRQLDDRELALALALAESPDLAIRHVAVRALGRSPHAPGVPERLRQALANPDTRLAALGALHPSQITEADFLGALGDPDGAVRRLAVARLGQVRSEDPRLLQCALDLAEQEPGLTEQIYAGILRSGEQGSATIRRQALENPLPRLRLAAISALAQELPPDQALPILNAARDDRDPAVRAQAIATLGRLQEYNPPKNHQPNPALEPAAEDHDALPQNPAALAEALCKIALDRHSGTEARLAQMCSEDICQKLLAALQAGGEPTAGQAAFLLASVGYQPAMRDTIAYYAFALPRFERFGPVHRFGPTSYEPLAAIALQHPDPIARRAAFQRLPAPPIGVSRPPPGQSPDDGTLERIIVMLATKAPDLGVRLEAIEWAGKMLSAAERDALVQALAADPSADIATKVRHCLSNPPQPASSVPRPPPSPLDAAGIVSQASAASWVLRCEAAVHTASTWNEAVRNAMFGLLLDPDARVRQAAATALCKRLQEDPEVVAGLTAMVGGDNRDEQLAVLRILMVENRSELMPVWKAASHLWQTPHVDIRLAMVQAASSFRSDSAMLRRLLDDPNRAVARAAAASLETLLK